jgi:cytochrome P450
MLSAWLAAALRSVLIWSVALLLALAAWVLHVGFVRPLWLRRWYRAQGLRGSPFRPFVGDLAALRAARSRRDEWFHRLPAEALECYTRPDGPGVYWFFFGPECRLRVHDLQLVKLILGDQEGVFEKTASVKRDLGRVLHGLLMREGAEHRAHRTLLSPAFHWLRLTSMTPLMVAAVDVMVDRWLARCCTTQGFSDAGSCAAVGAAVRQATTSLGTASAGGGGAITPILSMDPNAGSSNATSERSSCSAKGILVDLHHDISALTLEIICEAAFGSQVDTAASDAVYAAASELLQLATAQSLSAASFLLPWYGALPTPNAVRTGRRIAELKALLMDMIERRRRARAQAVLGPGLLHKQKPEGEGPPFGGSGEANLKPGGNIRSELLLDFLLDAGERRDATAPPPAPCTSGTTVAAAASEHEDAATVGFAPMKQTARNSPTSRRELRLTDGEIMDHALTFVVAGHETTSQALSWTMLLLAQHPEWKAKLRAQVLAACGAAAAARVPCYDDISRMPLLSMVLHESMRLYAPVPSISRTAARDVTLGPARDGSSLRVAAGTTFSIPIAAIHRDADYWPDPDVFNPLRFERGVAAAAAHPCAFLPFSHGPRSCVGQQFALLEARLVLARLLQRVEWEVDRSYVHAPLPVVTLRPAHGMPMRVWPLETPA